jgi:CRISPR-associated protein Cmr6
LDKYAKPGKMDQQQAQLGGLGLNRHTADPGVHAEVMARRKAALGEQTLWTRKSAAPLTLHLARASVLENASLCLHPIYGFPYLPGTGLKGLARAWAETVWADSQPDAIEAWRRIHEVFGVGDETDTDKRVPEGFVRKKDPDENDLDFAGNVIFHDAWPTRPPQLQIDFATPHHKSYYERKEPPGDWDSPEPAAFLSIPAGTEFQFAITASNRCSDPSLVEHARKWLNDALTIFGAGAKTNAGYGTFAAAGQPAVALPEKHFATSTHTLILTTPAFFAGDQSDPRSCNLRGGTLRGLLRWWWRTMHAGYLDARELHALEKTIWGGIAAESDEGTGSAVSIRIDTQPETRPARFDREELQRRFKLKWPDRGQRITPGLTFLSYGMAEKEPKRYYLPAGATWGLLIRARSAGGLSARKSIAKR